MLFVRCGMVFSLSVGRDIHCSAWILMCRRMYDAKSPANENHYWGTVLSVVGACLARCMAVLRSSQSTTGCFM